ncbi:MAG: chromosomal replication initiator protein DnaA [Planctomycetota bacterium]|nr:chromosomal replication initiator protein DnaA [Planctomycetota bacterium]
MDTLSADVVSQVEARIAEKIGPQRHKLWFKNTTHLHLGDGFLKIGVPNMFIGSWIENHFSDVILEAATEITGEEPRLSFSIDPALSKNLKKRQLDSQVHFVANNPEREAREHRQGTSMKRKKPLRGRLEDFVVGSSNRLAHGCAVSVVESPATQYNPLFVHGGCGLGKTHLLQAIYNGIKQKSPQLDCVYVTGEEFTNHFVYAIKSNNRDPFRHRFRSVDVLLIDDIHFLANKKATQEEFLHTFNAIDAAGKQVVMASDAHPKLIGNLSESLVNRFVAGMVVKIDGPTFEHRVAILKHRLVQMNREIADPVVEYVADKITSNVRELEGAILKLLAFASISRQPITLALAQQALQEHLTKTAPIVRLSDIESVSAIFFGLSPGDLHTSRKTRTIALSRGVAMWLARKHTTMSYPEIGRLMGNKNHSTVILARAKMDKILHENGMVRWNTPTGEKQMSLLSIISEMEEQLGLPISHVQADSAEQPSTTAPAVLARTTQPTPMDGNAVPAPQESVPSAGAPSA